MFETSSAQNKNDMVFVSGGMFIMGDTFCVGCTDAPKHNVTVNGFYIGKYEVTIEQYNGYREAINNSNRLDEENVDSERSQYPIGGVSWYDAVEYCNWRSEKEKLTLAYSGTGSNDIACDFSTNGYRLPTEAEWEYAARGGIHYKDGYCYSGSNTASEVGWYSISSAQPIGGKNPNQLGIYDMSGNVMEWCWDWYMDDYYKKGENNNPNGPKYGDEKVVRGGEYGNGEGWLYVCNRLHLFRRHTSNGVGFRLVRSNL
ncbi:MAG: Protein of unknown function precursor [Firmicutes bacterium]|nr:Protein of unknown function precursor [Bacillota bacterium]